MLGFDLLSQRGRSKRERLESDTCLQPCAPASVWEENEESLPQEPRIRDPTQSHRPAAHTLKNVHADIFFSWRRLHVLTDKRNLWCRCWKFYWFNASWCFLEKLSQYTALTTTWIPVDGENLFLHKGAVTTFTSRGWKQ